MQAAVTVAFRLLDIIFDLHDMYVILRHQAVTDQIYILDIGTDYAHSGDIVNIVARCAECQIKILFLKLSQNAFRRFQPRINVMDRAAQFAVFKLILYDLKARGRRAHRCVVHAQDRINRLGKLLLHIRDMLHVIIDHAAHQHQTVFLRYIRCFFCIFHLHRSLILLLLFLILYKCLSLYHNKKPRF